MTDDQDILPATRARLSAWIKKKKKKEWSEEARMSLLGNIVKKCHKNLQIF